MVKWLVATLEPQARTKVGTTNPQYARGHGFFQLRGRARFAARSPVTDRNNKPTDFTTVECHHSFRGSAWAILEANSSSNGWGIGGWPAAGPADPQL
ncbi:hypothetical protein GGQ85_004536 [Nitrobacter vulgaris]|nr:hypothetical protein [Nitrobacter vulgaris]